MGHVAKRFVYILKWADELEKYVKYDERNDDYLQVIIAQAQVFQTHQDAEVFANQMNEIGYNKPEIIKVIDA